MFSVLETNKIVHLTENGILLITFKGDKKDKEKWIYKGKIKPLRELNIEGNRFYEVETYKVIRGTVKNIVEQLKTDGGVTSNSKIQDAINSILAEAKIDRVKGYATYGVYGEGDRLNLVLKPFPITDSQNYIVRSLQKGVKCELTQEKLKNYITAISFWSFKEILPVMGLSLMATFSPVLKSEHILLPFVFHVSSIGGLGKTTVGRIFTTYLFGIPDRRFSAIMSDFRLADTIDSVAGLILVDETKYLKKEILENIKQAAESYHGTSRGRTDLSMRRYKNRASFVFTANSFPIVDEVSLVRFLKIRFDESKLKERKEKSRDLTRLLYKLKPIGFRLVELELERLNYSKDNLLNNIEKHGEILSGLYDFKDSRRIKSWAVIYEGLKAWQYSCEKLGVNWRLPSIEEFVKEVVEPIEEDTFEDTELEVDDFLNWFLVYRFQSPLSTLNEDAWAYREVVVKGEKLTGYLITKPILSMYKRNHGSIPTLGELARGVAYKLQVPVSEIYNPRRFKIGGKTRIAVFVPEKAFDIETEDEKSEILEV